MTYREAISYLDSLGERGWVFGLKGVKGILSRIGNPEKDLRVIHVAGTNGKGSTCWMVARVLEEHGFKVGLYTSPHILSFRERIVVSGRKIGRDEVAEYVSSIKASLDGYNTFTYFDFTTAMAFRYFRDYGVDVAVVEVGLGGRLDSTNVVNPLVSVITSISYDHTDVLGDSLDRIAWEKSGIIKQGKPVVSAVQAPEAERVIMDVSREKGSTLFFAGYRRGDMFTDGVLSSVAYFGKRYAFRGLRLPLLGDFQLSNLAVALASLEVAGFELSESKVAKALSGLRLPGRVEVVEAGGKKVVFDVSHNRDGVKVLVDTVRDLSPFCTVVGVMRDKDWRGIIGILEDVTEEFVYIPLPVGRAESPENLKIYRDGRVFGNALDAARYVAGLSSNVLVTGSFYTVSEMKRAFLEVCSG